MSIQRQLIRGNNTSVEAATLLAAQYAFDTTKNEGTVGNGAIAGGVRLAKKNLKESLAPTQITANTNDYNPAGLKHAGILFVSVDAAHDLTGMVPTTTGDTTDGREIELYNTGATFSLTLRNQNASSTAPNRFDLGGTDLVLAPSTNVKLRYSNAEGRWQLCSSTTGAAVGAAAIIARTLAASSQGFSMINGTLVASVSGGALTVAIKTLAGADPSAADPVLVLVRDATLTAGDYTMMSLVAATSLVISSGSSMGVTGTNIAFRLWLIGINDAGTFRLGAINALRGGAALPIVNPENLVTSTAEGGAGNADSFAVFYTGTAVASKPFAVLGFLDWSSGLATAAGTWDAGPTTVQLFGEGLDLPGTGVSAVAKRSCGMTGGTIVESHSANAVTYAVKAGSGNDPSASEPVHFTFQNGAGGYSVRTITAALSVTVPSGQAVGTSNGVAFRLWLVAIDTGSGVVLGVVNCLSGASIMGLLDSASYSSTAIATAPSAQVIYSTAAQASKFICLAGYADYDSGMATAGTWNASPTRIMLFEDGVPRPGERIGGARTSTGAVATGTTSVPFDDTIPQNTEGDQYMSVPYTPAAKQNVLKLDAEMFLSNATATAVLSASLYQDTTANALVSGLVSNATTVVPYFMKLAHAFMAGVNVATTIKARAGANSGTTTFNGVGGSRNLGGALNSYIDLQELMG